MEGAGRVGWQAAEDADAWGCGAGGGSGDDDDDDDEGSGSSSSRSDSLPDSLEAEPDSSKKLRVFLTTAASFPTCFAEPAAASFPSSTPPSLSESEDTPYPTREFIPSASAGAKLVSSDLEVTAKARQW